MAKLRPFDAHFFHSVLYSYATKLLFHAKKLPLVFSCMTFAPRPLSFYAGQKPFVLKTHKTQPPTLKKAKISLCKDVTPYHKNRKIKNSKKT